MKSFSIKLDDVSIFVFEISIGGARTAPSGRVLLPLARLGLARLVVLLLLVRFLRFVPAWRFANRFAAAAENLSFSFGGIPSREHEVI